jgi:hypothetical protein
MTRTIVTFVVLLALLLAIPWAIYAGHGHNGNASVFIHGSLGYTKSHPGGWIKVVPEAVPPSR